MDKTITTALIFLCCFFYPAKAQDNMNERVYLHLDKNCYIAGENIWYKFFVSTTDFTPSSLSKVGYIEICDAEKPQIQWIVSLKEGTGTGKFIIPNNTPSGIYRIYAYTKYMRNEGEKVFFEKDIAIINMEENTPSERVRITDTSTTEQRRTSMRPNIIITTDKNTYSNRTEVNLSLEMLPKDIVDLSVSVYRNDSIVELPDFDSSSWVQQVKNMDVNSEFTQYLPEYEGHIIKGRLVTSTGEPVTGTSVDYSSSIGFVGKDFKYINGMDNRDKNISSFFTGNIYGNQEIVTSVTFAQNSDYRMTLLSPYANPKPELLPTLTISPANPKLLDRYIAVQLQQIVGIDSLNNKIPLDKYYHFQNFKRYNLDHYTRFNTVRETVIEFLAELRTIVVAGKRRFRVFSEETRQFTAGNTLVLLDGAPLDDHEYVLNYNPLNLHTVDIYFGKYLFANEVFDGMVAFTTHKGNLPGIQLSDNMQLLEYNCPAYTESFECPWYDTEEAKHSLAPDFRHTLYFNAFTEPITSSKIPLTFYTSDMNGEYRIVAEGLTKAGNVIYGTSTFNVAE